MSFQNPLFLLLLILIPGLFIGRKMKNRRQAAAPGVPSVRSFDGMKKSFKQKAACIPLLLTAAGIALLITALARPRELLGEEHKKIRGVAMQLVIDRSSSMNAEVETDKRFVRRMDIAKRTFSDFVFGNGKELPGRENDLIGLISFARYADTLAPLSSSHDILKDFLEALDTVTDKEEDGTSIGDAVALAAARLSKVGDENDADKGFEIKSRVIVLLTDGENNSGDRSPIEAAELAKQLDVRIYAVGFGGKAYRTVSGLLGSQRIPYASAVDEQALKTVSETTGGEYFSVDSPEDLIEVYKTIDALETSEIVGLEHPKYRELFYLPASAGIILILLSLVVEFFAARRYP